MGKFECATTILSGTDAAAALVSYGAKRALIVTDPFFAENGMAAELGRKLGNAEVRIFSEVEPDPTVKLAAKGASLCSGWNPDLILALGGGSAMDCAKGIMHAWGQSVPLVAVPTTSGSGSEVTGYAVLTYDGVKMPLVDIKIRPSTAILDSVYLQGMPAKLAADSGMDILAHCTEALVAANRSSFTDALSIHGMACVLEKLPKSVAGDCSVRMDLHEAATMAGIAFDQAGLGACHAVAHALGGVFHVPHGRLCAMLLPAVIRMNGAVVPAQYAMAAKRLGLAAAAEKLAVRNLAGEVERLRRTLGMPENLGQAGIDRRSWEREKDGILLRVMEDPCLQSNPVPLGRSQVEALCNVVAP